MGCVSWVLLDHGIRGRFRPPNGPPDSEKPLYLHISAGVQVRFPVSVDESTPKSPSDMHKFTFTICSSLSEDTL